VDEHKLCADCPDVDDLALKMAKAIDLEILRKHEAIFVIVVANATETVVKASPNLPKEQVQGVLRLAAQIAAGESLARKSSAS
jgi:hypothetical protein